MAWMKWRGCAAFVGEEEEAEAVFNASHTNISPLAITLTQLCCLIEQETFGQRSTTRK